MGKINQKVKMGSSSDKLMKIHDNILKVEQNTVKKRCAVKEKYELESEKDKKAVFQEDMDLRRSMYDRRSEIIKTIPNFWLTAFFSHHALGTLLTEEDQKIFKFLESVNVEDTEVEIPGYTITFNFRENPFFENTTLTKSISYSSSGLDIRGSDINWKVVPTGIQQESLVEKGKKQGCTNDEISFFTWFSDNGLRWNPDEVAKLIIEDLWPNAIKYFDNGNLINEEEDAIVEDFCLYFSFNEDSQK